MKKKLFLMLLAFIGFASFHAKAQGGDVGLSMTFDNEPLQAVLLRLEQNSSYTFLFTGEDISEFRVNGSVKDASFFEVLDFVLDGKPLKYTVDGKFISLSRTDGNGNRPQAGRYRTYGGYVFEKGTDEPVIGAVVRVLGTSIAAVTDLNGAFRFEYMMPEGSTMQVEVSQMGMKTVTVPLASLMTIYMEMDSEQLQGVVVTGIFDKPKESYTGAASMITTTDLQVNRGQNLIQTLKNVDASLNMAVNNIAGSNPNNIPQLSIRGNSSLPVNVQDFNNSMENTVNTPLIILDGFEISLTKLMDYNDDEIGSITLLKDAAATAIYGSRGANGVIVVTTKQPEPGQLKVNAEFGVTAEIPDISSYTLLNASEKLALENMIGLYGSRTSPSTEVNYQTVYNTKLRNVLSGVNTDWLSKPLRNGVAPYGKLRFEGGTDQFRWMANLSYKDIEGAMKTSARKTFNGGLTIMYTLDKVSFRNYLSITSNKADNGKYGSFSDYVSQQPYNDPYDSNGELVEYFPNFFMTSPTSKNPLYDASLNSINTSDYQEINENFAIDWRIIPELTFRGQFGITVNDNHSDLYYPAAHSYFADYSDEDVFRKGSYTYGVGKSNSYDGSFTLSYNKLFAGKHSLYAGLNYQVSQSESKSYLFVSEGYTSSYINWLPSALQYQENGTPSGSKSLVRRLGLTSNVNYTYDNRYYIDLSYRIDGSSSFGSERKYAPFWSAGIGWNVHNEKWFKNDVMNTWRLKASYGTTGTMNTSITGAKTVYEYVTDNRYLNWVGAELVGLGNPELTWQMTKETNLGTEFAFFSDRLRGSFDWYDKYTSNLLSYMNMPHASGFSQYLANVGEVRNRGWEASLQAYLVRNPVQQFLWSVGGQLVYNRNEIMKLSDAIKAQNEAVIAAGADIDRLFYEGRPQNSIYAVQSLGVDPSTGEEIYVSKDGTLTNTWNASDKVYLGSGDPLYRGIVNSMVQWKGFTFNVSFGFYWGGKTYNQTLVDRVEVTTTKIMSGNVDSRVLQDRWMNPGDNTFFKTVSGVNTRASSRFVMDDNVLELQSVSAQYDLRHPWLQRNLHLNTLVIGVNASDLFHWGTIRMERGTGYPYARQFQGYLRFIF